jgi:hypothetical protein
MRDEEWRGPNRSHLFDEQEGVALRRKMREPELDQWRPNLLDGRLLEVVA